jgi:phosphatidylglycerol---prolipoprotein diacylglyceryl transferase
MHVLLASFSYHPIERWGPVSPHGVGTALGFFLGAWLMARRAEPRGIPRHEVYNAVTWGAVGAIIGARGFYVLGHLDQFHSLKDVLAVWQGGLTMFGGFAGGLVLGLSYLRRHGFNISYSLDAAAPGFVVGVIIGRIGDLIIADHLGHPTHFFLGYKIPSGAEIAPGYGPPTYVPGAVVHQTALYDLAGALVLFGVIYLVQRRRPLAGTLFATFMVWYGVQRFFIDFTRNRELIESFFFGLSGSQWAALGFVLGGAVWLVRLSQRRKSFETEAPSGIPVPAAAAVPAFATQPEPPPPTPPTPPEPTPRPSVEPSPESPAPTEPQPEFPVPPPPEPEPPPKLPDEPTPLP